MSEPEPHEFVEDVADASMCICGIPALVHHAFEPKRPMTAPGLDLEAPTKGETK